MNRTFQIVAACIIVPLIHSSVQAAIPGHGLEGLLVEHDEAKLFSARYTGFQKVSMRSLTPNPAITIINLKIGRKHLSITLNNRTETFRIRTQSVRFSDQDKIDVEKMEEALGIYLSYQPTRNFRLIEVSRDILQYISGSSQAILSVQTVGLQQGYRGQLSSR